MPDDSLMDFIMDQLSPLLPGLRARRMFSGYGFYQADHFFGILWRGRFYLLTNDKSRRDFVERGMGPFTYESGKKIVSLKYFEVPADVLEKRDELFAWSQTAIRISARRDKKPKKARVKSKARSRR
jgi:DNA transformation protein